MDPKSINLQVGQKVKKGKKIGKIGNNKVNGGWEPHLHIQLSLGLGQGKNWPGVCNAKELRFWEKYCPNPAVFLGLNLKILNLALPIFVPSRSPNGAINPPSNI